jgi:predicted DNA-binding transcriptional regulator YafY
MKKSSTAYLFECYIWLINTIARGPISREVINEKWAHSPVNDYKQDYIPESNFHRWKNTIELLFDIQIKCNSNNEYYIEEAADLRGANMRTRMLNLMSMNSLLKDCKELNRQILFEPVPAGEQFLAPIIEALRDKHAIQMTYQGFDKTHPSTFVVEPYCLKMFKQRWYLLAYSPVKDKTLVYALDRMHEVEITKQKYELPNDFDAEFYFRNTYGVSFAEEQPEEVKISISAGQANYLRTLPLHPSQKEEERNEEYSVFSYYVVPRFEFCQELYQYGSDVEVLAPEKLRQEFARDAAKTNKMYNA